MVMKSQIRVSIRTLLSLIIFSVPGAVKNNTIDS
jgi:hypothetical protein